MATRKPPKAPPKSLAVVAAEGDRLETLKVLRDYLARELDHGAAAKDVAPLTLRLTDVLAQIDDIGGAGPTSTADEIAAKRRERRGTA